MGSYLRVAMMRNSVTGRVLHGSVEEFAADEQHCKVCATNSNFVNPSGLPDENHYTTIYDMYLIFFQCHILRELCCNHQFTDSMMGIQIPGRGCFKDLLRIPAAI